MDGQVSISPQELYAAIRGFGVSFDAPVLESVNLWTLILSLTAIVAIFRFKAGTIQTPAACSAAGVVLQILGVVE